MVEEATRKGKVSGSNPTGHEARDFTRHKVRLAQCAFPIIKIFFFLFLKIDYVFSVKHFYRRFLVTACRIGPLLLASSTGGAEKR